MKVRQAVKKIVALGVGAAMLGATVLGAAAADLKDFPGMFINADTGSFNGLFVVGAAADTVDVIGINSITAAVQAAAVKKTWVDLPGSEATFVEGDGQFIADGSKEMLAYEDDGVSSEEASYDDDNFPVLLASGTVSDDDGENEDYDYDQKIIFANSTIKFDTTQDEDLPSVYLDFNDAKAFTYDVDFTDNLLIGTATDGEGLQDSESIEMLGKEYTFKRGIDNNDKIVLYKSSISQTLSLGTEVDVQVAGEDYVVELIAIDSDASDPTATIKVNGDTESMVEGDQKTVGGLEINIDDIQINTIGDESGFVRIFLGADEVELPRATTTCTSNDYTEVKLNGDNLQGVEACVLAVTNNSDVTDFKFKFTPSDFDNEIDELYGGDSFVDPLFNTFKYEFVDSNVKADDMVKLSSDYDKLSFEFTNVAGEDVKLNLLELNSSDEFQLYDSSAYTIHESVFDGSTTLTNVSSTENLEDYAFILSEDAGTEDELSAFYVVTNVDYDSSTPSDSDVTIKNLNTGESTTIKTTKEIGDTGAYVHVGTHDELNITDSATSGASPVAGLDYVKTNNQARVTFDAKTVTEAQQNSTTWAFGGVNPASSNADITLYNVKFAETNDANNFDDVANSPGLGMYSVYFGLAVEDSDELHINYGNQSNNWFVNGDGDYDDNDYLLTQAGTNGVFDSKDEKSFEAYVPESQVEYNVWFGPANSNGEAAEGSNGYYTTEVVPIPATASVLDTEVTNPTSENLILVGGPCVNTVAATLLKSTADCAAGFSEGKAMIKLFDDSMGMAQGKVALLVAGYNAADTRRATTVLSSYDSYKDELTGMEVEVVGTANTVTSVGVPVADVPETTTTTEPTNTTTE